MISKPSKPRKPTLSAKPELRIRLALSCSNPFEDWSPINIETIKKNILASCGPWIETAEPDWSTAELMIDTEESGFYESYTTISTSIRITVNDPNYEANLKNWEKRKLAHEKKMVLYEEKMAKYEALMLQWEAQEAPRKLEKLKKELAKAEAKRQQLDKKIKALASSNG